MTGSDRMSLRSFAGFVRAGSRSRLTLVRQAYNICSSEYVPYQDPYRPLRTAIVKMHMQNLGPEVLEDAVESTANSRQRTALREAAADYLSWLDGRQPETFPVAAGDWRYDNAQVRVNPEIGLVPRRDALHHEAALPQVLKGIGRGRDDHDARHEVLPWDGRL
ncbi:MAG: hypothetical protein IBX63_10720 [Coriobacteriia bacterium]|nr:hypothetical protein [Coriobacteriia bacterium]